MASTWYTTEPALTLSISLPNTDKGRRGTSRGAGCPTWARIGPHCALIWGSFWCGNLLFGYFLTCLGFLSHVHSLWFPCQRNRLIGLVVKAPASRAADPWFDSRLWCGDFSVSSHSSDLKIGTPVATLPGSGLGLAGPESVYCDWVRWKVWSATSVSVWQHIHFSKQIRPWDTLTCCWDVKQPTNSNHSDFRVWLSD